MFAELFNSLTGPYIQFTNCSPQDSSYLAHLASSQGYRSLIWPNSITILRASSISTTITISTNEMNTWIESWHSPKYSVEQRREIVRDILIRCGGCTRRMHAYVGFIDRIGEYFSLSLPSQMSMYRAHPWLQHETFMAQFDDARGRLVATPSSHITPFDSQDENKVVTVSDAETEDPEESGRKPKRIREEEATESCEDTTRNQQNTEATPATPHSDVPPASYLNNKSSVPIPYDYCFEKDFRTILTKDTVLQHQGKVVAV
eukprot:PhF_6_TR6080/c0_g2_i1/m.8862